MPSSETLERFIAKVESNQHDKAIAEFYREDAFIQENQGEIKRGRDYLVAGEVLILARAKSLTSECIRPYFVEGDKVVIRWKFRFVWQNDSVTEMEEIAYQKWDGELLVQEQFFYDPAQRTPKPAPTGWQ